jgi:acyl-[acyl-carrier-protein]-phospholipid O-acyltransferase/long-chain-fatty-acid--[acyl-carrier-protein] ligase
MAPPAAALLAAVAWPWLLAAAAAVVLYFALGRLFPGVFTPACRLAAHVLYRFHVHHAERVPAAGPVLIVCNHVTYVDWLLLWAAAPRPLTFVIWSGFLKNPVLGVFLYLAGRRIIPIDNARGRPHAATAALDRVRAALNEGRAVVVFPEGTLTRNGQMLPFGRGIEWVLKRAGRPVPVVPAYLDNLWGSVFSWSGGRVLWKWPAAFRRRVAVYFGEPLPPTATAAEARAAVQRCNAECGIRQSDFIRPVHREFVRNGAAWRFLRKTAFVDVATGAERKLTWPRALVAVWCLSRWLKARLGPEPNVGVWLPTGLGSALANLALTFLRKTTINLNYTAGADPLLSAVRQAEIRTVITSKRFLDRVPLELPGDVPRLYLEDALGSISGREKLLTFLAVLLLPGWLLERLLGLTRTRLDDVLTILFSSGSTGEPKGVMLSYRNVSANVDGFRRGVDLRPDDRMLATLPFFHTFGNTVCLWAPVAVGMEAVFFPDPRAGQEIGELCRKHRCTILLGTATFLRFYLRRAKPGDFDSLRLLICGAEKLPVKLAEEFRGKFGVLPLEGYGCTELSPVVSTNLHDVEVGGLRQKANTPGTVGQPIPNVCARAVDQETYEPLPPATEGLLLVTGPNVMLGYLHQPEKTRQVIRDGWYVTGDVGLVEADGFIRITGRISRFAKIGGEMVPLERLDEEMHDILGSNGDRVLAVAAVPDEKRGERVVVLYLPAIGDRLDEVFAQLRERGLPNLWIPDRRDCYPVDEFPTLGSGKLDLKHLGDLAKELAGAR